MNRDVTAGFAWGGGIVALALAATLAHQLGVIGQDTVLRVVIGVNGIMIAWYGNRMPKAVVPSACVRQANRAAGWSMVLSGIVYAGLWAFAPIPVATWGGCIAVIAGIAATVRYCLSLRNGARQRS